MELLAVGRGRDVAGVPLPPAAPARDRAPMTGAVSVLTGALVVDEGSDPVATELSELAAEVRAVTAAAARFDTRLVAAYDWGAAELAARCGDPEPRRRQEWGARGMLAELAATLHVPEGSLARRLARITMLAAFPALQAAHTAGLVSSAHVDGVLDAFHGVTDPDVLARADAALADRAARVTAPQLRAAARRWRSGHVARTAEQRARAVGDRFVDVSPADDDLCWLTALLPAASAMGVMHRIDDLASSVAGPDEPRTLPQLRADVLCDLLLSTDTPAPVVNDGCAQRPQDEAEDEVRETGSSGRRDASCPQPPSAGLPSWVRGIVPQVVLTVPVLILLGQGEEPAELEGFGPIDLDTARALCANAPTFTRVLTHPETGAVLSVGRDRYTIPADLRRAVTLRDRTCRFPGCRRRAARCDIDHSTAWAHGGRTDLDNLATLCRKHHRLKHQTGWAVTHGPGGTLHWHSPTGKHYRTQAAAALWPPPPAIAVSSAGSRAPGRPPNDDPRPSGYPETPPF